MFTLQASQLQALREYGDWRDAIGELVSILTNCNATLEHRGPVRFLDNVTIFGEEEQINTFIQFNGPIRWAKATSNWFNAAGNGSYVDCQLVEDRLGTNPTTAQRVYLPRFGSGRDPNVETGDVIGFFYDAGGEAIADCLDATIGSVRQWTRDSADIPQGWAFMNATDNGGVLGSGIDMVGHFVFGLDTGTPSNTAFGSDQSSGHTHAASSGLDGAHSHTVTIGSSGTHGHNIIGDTASVATGVTLDPHDDHQHWLELTPQVVQSGTGINVSSATGACTTSVGVVADCLTAPTGNELSHAGLINDPMHQHGAGTLTTDTSGAHAHSGTTDDPGDHSHSVTVELGGGRDLHKKLYFIERFDNSVNAA